MQPLPFSQERIVSIDKERVIELRFETLQQGTQAREIDHKPTVVQTMGRKPELKAAAVTMHEAAVPWVPPLAMATGEPIEPLAAGVRRRRCDQNDKSTAIREDSEDNTCSPEPGMQLLSPTVIQHLRFNEAGLIPAIAQDWLDGAVLMVAWMNSTALEATLSSGEAHYWSRSRQTLWHKGATSGHIQTVRGIRYDCDADVLLLTVEQRGDIACHTGARSCFYDQTDEPTKGGAEALPPPSDACTELFQVIEGRQRHPEPGSYTNRLLDGGDNRILKKIGEESAEFVMACKDDNPEEIAGEAADILFHMQVALAHHGVSWRQVQEVLAARRGAPRRHSEATQSSQGPSD